MYSDTKVAVENDLITLIAKQMEGLRFSTGTTQFT